MRLTFRDYWMCFNGRYYMGVDGTLAEYTLNSLFKEVYGDNPFLKITKKTP
jgi:hypothetical protein